VEDAIDQIDRNRETDAAEIRMRRIAVLTHEIDPSYPAAVRRVAGVIAASV